MTQKVVIYVSILCIKIQSELSNIERNIENLFLNFATNFELKKLMVFVSEN